MYTELALDPSISIYRGLLHSIPHFPLSCHVNTGSSLENMGSRLQIYRQIYGSGVQPDQAAAISADDVAVGPRVLSPAACHGHHAWAVVEPFWDAGRGSVE